MRLVFVHGMRQEGKDPDLLRRVWESSLRNAWEKLGLAPVNYQLEMPFYGDELERLTADVRGGATKVVSRGAETGPAALTPLEQDLLRDLARKANVTDAEVRQELGSEVEAMGPGNWEWVQALARILERRAPILGEVALGFVRQVDSYLTRPHIRKAVDDIVAPTFANGPTVVVAHSLGTIVSYLLLRGMANKATVPLLVTLGSPLGIATVQGYLKPPALGVPAGVAAWLNGADERDYVALVSVLDRDSFADGVVNVSDIHNREEDAHSIEDYLSNSTVAQRIHAALA